MERIRGVRKIGLVSVGLIGVLGVVLPVAAFAQGTVEVAIHNDTATDVTNAVVPVTFPVPKGTYDTTSEVLLAAVDPATNTPLTLQLNDWSRGADGKIKVMRGEVLVPALPHNATTVVHLVPAASAPPTAVAQSVSDLLDQLTVTFEVEDMFGNTYEARIDPSTTIKRDNSGPISQTRVYHALAMPKVVVNSAMKLHHLLEFRAYVTAAIGRGFVDVELMIANGSIDHPLGDIPYKRITACSSLGEFIIRDQADHPYLGPTDPTTGCRDFYAPLTNGKAHAARNMQVDIYRVAIAPQAEVAAATAYLTLAPIGVAKETGVLNWTDHPWLNPIGIPVPKLPLYWKTGGHNVATELNTQRTVFLNGPYIVKDNGAGTPLPYVHADSNYGGVTGAGLLGFAEETSTAAVMGAGHRGTIETLEERATYTLHRQFPAYIHDNGRLFDRNDYDFLNGDNAHQCSDGLSNPVIYGNSQPDLTSFGGLPKPPPVAVAHWTYAANNNLIPGYWNGPTGISKQKPYDDQHRLRINRFQIAKALLLGSGLGRDVVLLLGEGSLEQKTNRPRKANPCALGTGNGNSTGPSLWTPWWNASHGPGNGISWSARSIEAGLEAVAAFGLTNDDKDPVERADVKGWSQLWVDMVADGQMDCGIAPDCNKALFRQKSNKNFGTGPTDPYATLSWQEALHSMMLLAVRESVLGDDPANAPDVAKIDAYLQDFAVFLAGPMGSTTTMSSAPYGKTPTAVKDPTFRLICSYLDPVWQLQYNDPSHPIKPFGGVYYGELMEYLRQVTGNPAYWNWALKMQGLMNPNGTMNTANINTFMSKLFKGNLAWYSWITKDLADQGY